MDGLARNKMDANFDDIILKIHQAPIIRGTTYPLSIRRQTYVLC